MKTIKQLRTIYWTSTDGYDEIGENDVFFDDKWNLIYWWHCNDASYRSEYMDGLLELAGAKMVYKSHKDLPAKAKKAIVSELGDY